MFEALKCVGAGLLVSFVLFVVVGLLSYGLMHIGDDPAVWVPTIIVVGGLVYAFIFYMFDIFKGDE